MTPNKWELWWADVAFEDDPTQSKVRPVLVVAPDVAYILSLYVTTKDARKHVEGDYEIRYWSESGLPTPSTIRTAKKLRLVATDFSKKIGRLHHADARAVMKLLEK